jgi:trk system potassium uptake protein TrkA
MRTIIVGSGRVGAGLASQLAAAGHDVTILDVKTEAFRRLAPGFSGRALRGDGADESVLRRAGAEDADWFFALTNGDNRNVLAGQLASETFGIPRVLCKINDPVRAKTYATLGIDTINRTDMMIDSISRYMGLTPVPGAADVNVAQKVASGVSPTQGATPAPAPAPASAADLTGGR